LFVQLLATKKPEYYWSTSTDASEQEVPLPSTQNLLHTHQDTIIEEYVEYERRINEGDESAVNRYDPDHEDSWMTKRHKDEKSAWEYLRLRSAGGRWDEELCAAHFPQTCRLLQQSIEIDGPFPKNARCEGYCQESYRRDQRGVGMVSFYRLAPGKGVPEHAGGDNNRLK
jgi:hypothetical protein